jgi:hypothetical protein
MDSEIFDYVDDKSTLKLMNGYEKKGWKFRIEAWENHHNGNPEWHLEFKSPRMKDFRTIMGEYEEKFSEKKLLDYESNGLSNGFLEYNKEIVTDLLRIKIYELFRQNPKVKTINKSQLKVNLEITYETLS